ncbi:hypothetical protein LCGC14_2753740, partial [marine sediment metagenome]
MPLVCLVIHYVGKIIVMNKSNQLLMEGVMHRKILVSLGILFL